MNNKRSAWPAHPDYYIDISMITKRISMVVFDEVIADSQKVLLLNEQGRKPVYYFPTADVCFEQLQKIDNVTFCPYKGEAEYWALRAQNEQLITVAWRYHDPFEQVKSIKNHIAFYSEVLDHIIIE